uniref:Uncharacterized protein n=1 Tax=Physcomitrium patens TaxID=3218 RepID=A0A2K1JQ57_PHYPA|nr:hypothetical protein PHYPA_016049 [Physcomitrium patens]
MDRVASDSWLQQSPLISLSPFACNPTIELAKAPLRNFSASKFEHRPASADTISEFNVCNRRSDEFHSDCELPSTCHPFHTDARLAMSLWFSRLNNPSTVSSGRLVQWASRPAPILTPDSIGGTADAPQADVGDDVILAFL